MHASFFANPAEPKNLLFLRSFKIIQSTISKAINRLRYIWWTKYSDRRKKLGHFFRRSLCACIHIRWTANFCKQLRYIRWTDSSARMHLEWFLRSFKIIQSTISKSTRKQCKENLLRRSRSAVHQHAQHVVQKATPRATKTALRSKGLVSRQALNSE